MNTLGNIKIADDVVKVVVAKAVKEVEGVAKLASGVTEELTKIFSKKAPMAQGVKVEVGEKECSVDAYISVEYGYSIPKVAEDVQGIVIKNITEITGLKVLEVNVYVQDIVLPSVKEEKVETEEEKDTFEETIEILD